MPQTPKYEREKRQAKVARYVARGLSYQEIADLLDISRPQVYRDYKAWAKHRRERLRMDHDAAFLETLNGYEEAIRRAWEQLSDPLTKTEPKVIRDLIETIGKLTEKKARLLGLVEAGEGTTVNVLALAHPEAAKRLERVVTPDRAAQIEAEIFEGEFAEVPLLENADEA